VLAIAVEIVAITLQACRLW